MPNGKSNFFCNIKMNFLSIYMNFSRLYSILFEKEEAHQKKYENADFSKHLVNKSPQQVWQVAQDIRRHIEDYPDFNIPKLIRFSGDIYLKKNDVHDPNNKEVANHPLAKAKGNPLYVEDHDKKFVYILHDTNYDKTPPIMKISFDQLSKYAKADMNLYHQRNRMVRTRLASSYYSTVQNFLSHGDRMMKMVSDKDKKSRDTNLLYKWNGMGNAKNLYKDMVDITKEDKNFLFNYYRITTPHIYRYLLDNAYDLIKHPDEIPPGLQKLPSSMLESMYEEHKTPLEIAKFYSRFTDMGDEYQGKGKPTMRITGFARVLDIDSNAGTNFPINKKEAYDWLKYVANLYDIKTKEYMGHDDGVVNDDDGEPGYSYNIEDDVIRMSNFPSWFMREKMGTNYHDASFQSWMTFRWFILNHKSSYFGKEIQVHGPAGQTNSFIPGRYLAKIQDVDLVNGMKTSPEVAFQKAAEREAREFEEKNKEQQFTYGGKEYKDTDKVKVIRNSVALKHEGARLKHCVGGYGPSCLNGRSLILSLPHSTAELNPQNLAIYQHRGLQNAGPPVEDTQALQEWIKLNGK